MESIADYPPEWKNKTIQKRIRKIAGYRCEHCGMEFIKGSTKAKTARTQKGKPIILTIHHLDGYPPNCTWRNLIAVCQGCHLHIQALWKPGEFLPKQWEQPPKWMVVRNLDYKPNQQMRLF